MPAKATPELVILFDDEVREAGRRLERIRALRAQDDPDDDAIGEAMADALHACMVALAGAAALLGALEAAPSAIMDTRHGLGVCAEREDDFPALYALKGRRVLLVDLGPNVADKRPAVGGSA